MRAFVPVVSLLIVASAAAQDYTPAERAAIQNAPKVLRRVIERSEKQKYSGTRLISYRRGPKWAEHTEIVFRDGLKSRVEFPDGSVFAGQIIIESGGDRRQYFPTENKIRVVPARREESLRRLMDMVGDDEGFSFAQTRGETVAGSPTALVTISDRSGNVVQRLYIEPRRGVILRRQIYDKVGGLIGSFEFKDIDFDPKFDASTFQFTRKGAKIVTPEDELRNLLADGKFLARGLTAAQGYRLEDARILRFSKEPLLVQMYVGPGGRVALHQSKGPIDGSRLARFARGNTNFRSWQAGGRSFVLIGDMSVNALKDLSRTLGDSGE